MTHVVLASPNWYNAKVVTLVDGDDDKKTPFLAFGGRTDINILQISAGQQRNESPENYYVERTGSESSSANCDNSSWRHCNSDNTHKNNNSCEMEKRKKLTNRGNSLCINGDVHNNSTSNGFHHQNACDYNLLDQNHASTSSSEKLLEKEVVCTTSSSNGLDHTHNGLSSNGNDRVSDLSGDNRPQTMKCDNAKHSAVDCVLVCTLSRVHKDKITALRLLKCTDNDNRGCDCGSKTATCHSYYMFSGADNNKVKCHHLSWCGDAFQKLPTTKSMLKCEYSLSSNRKVTCMELCGEEVAIGDDKGNVTCWKWRQQLPRVFSFDRTNSPILSLEFEERKKFLAIGRKNGTIIVIDLTTGATVSRLNSGDDVQSLQWKPPTMCSDPAIKGHLISGSKDRSIKLWNINDSRCVKSVRVPDSHAGNSGGSKPKVIWICVAWLPTGQIISTSASGELFVWSTNQEQWSRVPLSTDKRQAHNRLIFTLSLFSNGTRMISTSMDKSILMWDITHLSPRLPRHKTNVLSAIEAEGHVATNDVEGLWQRGASPADTKADVERSIEANVILNMPSFGGFCYCVRASPVDPGKLAIGVGDGVVRLWNVNKGSQSYDIKNISQGVVGKVISLAWHPFNENQLAFGTDNGGVGVFKGSKVTLCSSRHNSTVYVVTWGPPPLTDANAGPKTMVLYSVGSGEVLVHSLSKDAALPDRKLEEMLTAANGSRVQTRIRSELTWSHDYRYMYLGSDDGSVLVIRRDTVKCLCVIKVNHKLVNAVRPQPQSSASSSQLLAIGTNEVEVKVVDLACISRIPVDANEVQMISEPAKVLTPLHKKGRVTDMSWCPFDSNQLVTVHFDGGAVVWDVASGSPISIYKHQHGNLLTCQWSLLDADLVYTGSAEYTLHSWQPSFYKREISASPADSAAPALTSTPTVVSSATGSGGDEKVGVNLMQLIEEKKKELSTVEVAANVESSLSAASKKSQKTKNKKKAGKSLFPNLTAKQKTSDQMTDLLHLQTRVAANEPVTNGGGTEHLGLYSIDNDNDFDCFLSKELDVLYADGQYEPAGLLSLCQGNVEEHLKKAHQANALSDSLVNSASMVSYTLWTKYCRLYAQQLRTAGEMHQACTYLLYAHEVDTALQWLTEENYYREAIVLMRSRFPHDTERIKNLYTAWSVQLRKDANHETAAKCFVSLRNPCAALDVLSKRSGSFNTANVVRFGLSSPETTDKMLMTCDQLTRQHLLAAEYKQIEELCSPHTVLHPFLAWSLITQALMLVFESGSSTEIASVGIIEFIKQLLSPHGIELSACCKRCSLTQSNISVQQVQIAITERLLNLAVLAEETTPACDLVNLFELITRLQMSPLEPASTRKTAGLIDLFKFPGYNGKEMLIHCPNSFEETFLESSPRICYLWAALTLELTADPETVDSKLTSTEHAQAGSRADAVPWSKSEVAVYLCRRLEIVWMDKESIQTFKEYLDVVEEEHTLPSTVELPSHEHQLLNVYDLVSFVDQEMTSTLGLDLEVAKCVLAMSLDLLRQLFVYMCCHDDDSCQDGKTMIKEWVVSRLDS